MDSTFRGAGLLEREQALEEIDAVVEAARAGRPALLLIEGGAGEGKSALVAQARERAEDAPLTLADDAHRLSPEALDTLVARPGARVVAFRPAEPGADEVTLDALRTRLEVRQLVLGPLGRDSVAALVRRSQPRAGDDLVDHVHSSTGGNPQYVAELLAGDPGRKVVIAIGDRVLRRAGALDTRAAQLLGALAVVGDGERLTLVATVAGVALEVAQPLAHRLRRMGILASEDPAAFAQPLVGRSIRAALSDPERNALHAQAASTLRDAQRPVELVAAHLAELIPDGSAEVSAGLIAAADAAERAETQLRWLRRALTEQAPEPPRAALLHRLGNLELVARDGAAIIHLREALELSTEPSVRAHMGIDLAEILAHAGQWDDAMAIMRSVEDDLGPAEDELRVRFAGVLAVAAAHDTARVGWFDRERPRLDQLARGSSWSAHALTALLGSITAARADSYPEARRLAERSIADGVLLAEQGGGGWAAPHVLAPFVVSDDLGRALELCEEVGAAARRAGAVTGELVEFAYRGWALAHAGELAHAELELQRAVGLVPDLSLQMISATLAFVAIEVLVERPGLAELAAAAQGLQLEPAFADTWSGGMARWARGRLRLVHRDRAGGIEDLREVGRVARGLRFGPGMVPWRSELALALPAEQHDEALELAEEELELARATSLARSEGVALRALGVLTPGAAGVDLLRSAIDVLAASPARLEHARALLSLGSVLRRARRNVEAREALQAGLELASRCGAVRLSVRAREELAAAAGRPSRRQAREGRLTASELRVARLAVSGASNPDIARELFVSLKTVESHLSHVYTKLGLAGRGARRQLAAALSVYEPAQGYLSRAALGPARER